MIQSAKRNRGSTPPDLPVQPMRRGVAIVLVIVAVAAASVIGTAYLASQINAPQIVSNVNAGLKSRYLADSGADLAMAIMECNTFDWRAAQSNGVLLANLPIGDGSVSIEVKDVSGAVPAADCEYPVIVTRGVVGNMKQVVGMQVHTPLPQVVDKSVSVDLREFAVFGGASIDVVSGWIARWPASPLANLGLPLKVGTNGTARGSLKIADRTNAPDAIGYVMQVADPAVILDSNSTQPIRREDFSVNETVLLPAPPTPNYSGLTWASVKAPTLTSNTNITLTSDKRYNSLTIDNAATLSIDLGGASRMVGISGPLTIRNQAVLFIDNGHLDLVVQDALTLFNLATIELGPNATLRLFIGGTVSVDDSVLGLPVRVRDLSRDARRGLDEYFDPQRCTIYRITSISSTDTNTLDADNATDWSWTGNTIQSWIINTNSYVCGRIYGHSKVALSLDNRSAVFGNVVGNSVILANESVVYYDHSLDPGNGYTNPDSRLYAAPLDLRDDIRFLLTDLNAATLASIQMLLMSPPPMPIALDPAAPTPRDSTRVTGRWWKRFGVKVARDRATPVETVIAAENL